MRQNTHELLGTLAGALKVFAWIVLVLGIIGGVMAIVAGQQGGDVAAARGMPTAASGLATSGTIGGILAIVMAIVWFLILYGIGEICSTVRDLWINSRRGLASDAAQTNRLAETSREPGIVPPSPAPG